MKDTEWRANRLLTASKFLNDLGMKIIPFEAERRVTEKQRNLQAWTQYNASKNYGRGKQG